MPDSTDEAPLFHIVFHNDAATPRDFVIELLRTVFGQSEPDAATFTNIVDREGRNAFGAYAPDVAQALLIASESRVRAKGHPLKLTVEPVPGPSFELRCGFCGKEAEGDRALFKGRTALICGDCVVLAATNLVGAQKTRQFKFSHEALAWHFAGIPSEQIAATSRQFPGHMRADVQVALDAFLAESPLRFFGLHELHRYETVTLSSLMKDGQFAIGIAPAQYQDLDIGEERPVRCLGNGLWLCREGDLRYAVVLSMHREFGQESGTCIEIAVPAGAEGAAFTQRCFESLEAAVYASRSYRGKVLSFDQDTDYRGRSKGILVHKLAPVARDEVILPPETLKLIDRNVFKFIGSRDGLRGLGQSTRKGILLYGPPGTGKTHTIRYLASHLPGHTTLIITAGQIGALGQYMSLARLMQPCMVVIEDVDLIARARENMNGTCEEALLNMLLNEMDGLKENADILFVLTTNRPEQLEAALTSRPGRIDQAIEVPLPDEEGRAKLVRLYGRGLALDDALVSEAVKRTKGVSAAFIKEMMRRTAQAMLERGDGHAAASADLDTALNDMLFTGGRLNVALLGGAEASVH